MSNNQVAIQISHKKAWFILVLVLLFFSAMLLVLHKIPSNYPGHVCAENYQIAGPFWIVLNCDAREFMRGAEDLNNLLDPGYVRQSRPGTVILANLISKVLGPIINLGERLLAASGREFHGILNRWLHEFVAYLIINFSVVISSFWLYIRLAGSRHTITIPALASGSLIILNNIGKAFMLTPHTALIELLVPLVTLTLYLWLRHARNFMPIWVILTSIGIGLAAMAYPGFLIAAPAIVVADMAHHRCDDTKNLRLRVPIWGLLSTAIMLLPLVLWMTFLSYRNGGFQAAEFSGNELVWLIPAFQEGVFNGLGLLLSKIRTLGLMALKQMWPFLPIFTAIFLIVRPREIAAFIAKNRRDPIYKGVLLVSGLAILFFALIGLPIPRRAYMAVPAMIGLLGWALERLSLSIGSVRATWLSVCVCLAVLFDAIVLFMQQGPYS